MSPFPAASPAPSRSAAPRPSGPLPRWSDLKAIADAQRSALVALLAGFLAIPLSIGFAGVFPVLGGGVGGAEVGAIAFLLVVLGVRAWMAVAVYRLSRALGSRVGVFWAIGAFLPNIIGLLVLAVVSARATNRLKKAGLKVGLLGAKLPATPPPGFLCEEVAGAFS